MKVALVPYEIFFLLEFGRQTGWKWQSKEKPRWFLVTMAAKLLGQSYRVDKILFHLAENICSKETLVSFPCCTIKVSLGDGIVNDTSLCGPCVFILQLVHCSYCSAEWYWSSLYLFQGLRVTWIPEFNANTLRECIYVPWIEKTENKSTPVLGLSLPAWRASEVMLRDADDPEVTAGRVGEEAWRASPVPPPYPSFGLDCLGCEHLLSRDLPVGAATLTLMRVRLVPRKTTGWTE